MITIVTYGKSKRKEYPKTDVTVSCLGLDNPPSVLWSLDGRSADLRVHIVDQLIHDKKKGSWFARVTDHVLKCANAKDEFSIGFFCQGGRHRSVSIAELIVQTLRNEAYEVVVHHMELNV